MRVNKWVFWVILLVFSIFSTMFFVSSVISIDWEGLGMLVTFGFTYGITLITIFFINIITYFYKNDRKLTISKNFLMILLLVQGTALITNLALGQNLSYLLDNVFSFTSFGLLPFPAPIFILLVLYILIYSVVVIVLGIKVIIETIKSIIKKDIRIKRSNIPLILLLVVQFAVLFINLISCDSVINNSITCSYDSKGLKILLSGYLYGITFIVFIIHAYYGMFFRIVFRNIKSKWINPPLRKQK
jgi:hypothetical protein